MLKQFLQQTCNIYSVAISTTWGEQTQTETKIYSLIPCKIYQKKRFSLQETWLAEETETSSYSVIIESDKSNTDYWMHIEIIDWGWKNIWKFLIQSIMLQKNINWSPDYISLSVTKI